MRDYNLDIFNFDVPEHRRKLAEEPVNEDLIDKNKFANNSMYIPESVYKRILNKITNYKWSFVPHAIDVIDDKNKPYIRFIGMLVVPGFGIHTGIGTQPLDKKDNSNATAAAKTYAFKNACKSMGLAPNVGNKDFEEELFEHVSIEDIDKETFIDFKEEPAEKKPESKKQDPKKKNEKPKANRPNNLKDSIEEIRQAYELTTDDDFVAFIQIWDEEILELDDMDNDDWADFLEYLEANKKKFEDF